MEEAGKLLLQAVTNGDYAASSTVTRKEILKKILHAPTRRLEKISMKSLISTPAEWRLMLPISKEKFIKTLYSILIHDLFYPIIVWEKDDGNYMILSGYLRIDCYRILNSLHEDEKTHEIISNFKDVKLPITLENFKTRDFNYIEALIYAKHEINEQQAYEIIINSNYLRREANEKLTSKVLDKKVVTAVYHKELMNKIESTLNKEFLTTDKYNIKKNFT